MDYLTSGNTYVDQGTYLVALGAFLTSLGWYLLATHKQAVKWLEKWLKLKKAPTIIMFLIISALIIYGPRTVGRGGTLTTKGWNVLDNYEQKKALIQKVVNELIINDLFLPCENLPFDPNLLL